MEKPIHRIKRRLEELGKAKTTASKEAGLSAAFIRTMEDDPKRSMSGANAEKLAVVLKTTPQWLLFGVDELTSHEQENQFQLDVGVLDLAMLKTDQVLVGAKIKVSREDRLKMISFHYQDEMRRRHNLAPKS